MLYRLTPPARLEWNGDLPAGTQMFNTAVEHGADFDRLEWQATEDRTFGPDILKLALRYGVRTASGLVLNGMHTADLGRADRLRLGVMELDESQAQVRAQSGDLMEALIPGWTAHGEELDERVRETTERQARESEADLAEKLSAPVNEVLVEHWVGLGGRLPD